MNYAALDEALDVLRGSGPEVRNGAPNHGPMVAEALVALGRDDAVRGWVEGYRNRLAEAPKTKEIITGDWTSALGNLTLLAQWENFFRRELTERSWRDVLKDWLPRLSPGTMAAGTHGIIRCAHAVRALENEANPARLEELACALAYCASRYRSINGVPKLCGNLSVEEAVRALPLLDPEIGRQGVPPPRVVKQLDSTPDFSVAVQQLAEPHDVSMALSHLVEVSARLYLSNADRHPLVLLHAVTGPAALRLLLPHMEGATQHLAFSYMWQAVAAWAAAFGRALSDETPPETSLSWEEISERSVVTGDDHAIKLTEAARRENAINPNPVLQAAAADWVDRLLASKKWTAQQKVEAGMKVRLG